MFDRRTFLQAAGAMGVSFSLPPLVGRAAEQRGPERAKSLLTIWLQGGQSQLESWDPHPGTKIGGPTKAIATTIPGVQIADLYPRTAEQLHHVSVIRSLISKEGDHERGSYLVKTGYRPEPTLLYPAVGAIVAHERPNPDLQIPQYVTVGPIGIPSRAGYLGTQFDPFRVFAPGNAGGNLRASVEEMRQQRRLGGLDVVSQQFARGRTIKVEETLHQHTVDAALRMMTSPQLKAFELDDETAEVKAAYGDHQFGRGCLVARRLLETGVRSIEVALEGWDTHAENFEGQGNQAKLLDGPLAALLKDLADRDLLQSTIVLVISEFGRTPNINPLEGRDHWPTGFSCLIGGGGLPAGRVLGATDPEGVQKNPTDPVEIADLYATILNRLGVDYERELITPIGRPMKLCAGKPIEGLA